MRQRFVLVALLLAFLPHAIRSQELGFHEADQSERKAVLAIVTDRLQDADPALRSFFSQEDGDPQKLSKTLGKLFLSWGEASPEEGPFLFIRPMKFCTRNCLILGFASNGKGWRTVFVGDGLLSLLDTVHEGHLDIETSRIPPAMPPQDLENYDPSNLDTLYVWDGKQYRELEQQHKPDIN